MGLRVIKVISKAQRLRQSLGKSSSKPQKEPALPTPWPQTSGLQTVRERVSVFSAPSLWCFAVATLGLVYSIYALGWFDCSITCMLSPNWLFATPWTVAHQDPLSMGFPRQEYWSGLPCPPPGDLPDSGIEPWMSLTSPAMAGGVFTTEPPGKPCNLISVFNRLTPHGFVLSPSL